MDVQNIMLDKKVNVKSNRNIFVLLAGKFRAS